MLFHRARQLSVKNLILTIIPLIACQGIYADFMPPAPTPYSFGPEGRMIEDVDQYGKPAEMAGFLPNRPVAAHDKYGNREFLSPGGDMVVSISPDGKMTFQTQGESIQRDADGKVVSTTKNVRGTNRSEIRNEKGEIIGYQETGLGNKVTREYDYEGNLTKTRVYNTYGKNTQWVVDELSLTKTVCDKNGTPQYDTNQEGAVVARYYYDKATRLQSKVDQYGNTSFFDTKGNLTYTQDDRSQKMAQYNYKTNDDGRYVLDNIEDMTPGITCGNVTHFDKGQAQYETSRFGGNSKEYHYDGHTLQYVFDTQTNETTWYTIDGKTTRTTFDNYTVKEYLYHQARMVGYYDHYDKTVVLYQYERHDQTVKIYAKDNVPTADEIEQYYETAGMMTDVGASVLIPAEGKTAIARKSNIFGTNGIKRSDLIFDVVTDAKSDVTVQKRALEQVKYNYSQETGKVESVLSKAPDDPNGWVTSFYVDPTVVVTVSGEQSANKGLAGQLLQKILDNNQSIGDISTGSGELATFAKTIQTVTVKRNKLSNMTDGQIRNLMGWNKDGANTATCVADVRARTANAGNDGAVSITFGYGDESAGSPLYAAAISATDSNQYTVAGRQPNNRLLDLCTPSARDGVLVSAGETGATQTFPITETSYSPSAKVQSLNGVTRTYAANGTLISEVDSLLNVTTKYDSYGRKSETSGKWYTYADDGSLQSIKSSYTEPESGRSGYITTFFVGWGAAQNDQPSITVYGDQTGNASLAAELWTAITGGESISDIASGKVSSGLSSFTQTLRTVTVNPSVFTHMTDQQACNILGLDISNTGFNLANLQKWASNVGADGTFSIDYDKNLCTAQIQVYRGSKVVATLFPASLSSTLSSAADATGVTSLSDVAANISASLLK